MAEVVGLTLSVLPLVVSLQGALRFEQNKARDRELVLSFVGLQKERIDEIQDELIRLQAERKVLHNEIKSLRGQTETVRMEMGAFQPSNESIKNTERFQLAGNERHLCRDDEFLRGHEECLQSLGGKIDLKLKT